MSTSPRQLDPRRTTWHITFGTYGARLHGGDRPTVDKQHNQRGEAFIDQDSLREEEARNRMRAGAVYLTREQRGFAQEQIVPICERGGWSLRTCAAQWDHVHVLADVEPAVHGEKVRRLIKRWLGQALDEQFGKRTGSTWWAEEGSNKVVDNDAYLSEVFPYIERQRTT